MPGPFLLSEVFRGLVEPGSSLAVAVTGRPPAQIQLVTATVAGSSISEAKGKPHYPAVDEYFMNKARQSVLSVSFIDLKAWMLGKGLADQNSVKVILKYPGRNKYLLFDSKKPGTFFFFQEDEMINSKKQAQLHHFWQEHATAFLPCSKKSMVCAET